MNHIIRYPMYPKHPDPLELVPPGGPPPEIECSYVDMDTSGLVPGAPDPEDVKVVFDVPRGFTTDWTNVERMFNAMRRQYRMASTEQVR